MNLKKLNTYIYYFKIVLLKEKEKLVPVWATATSKLLIDANSCFLGSGPALDQALNNPGKKFAKTSLL